MPRCVRRFGLAFVFALASLALSGRSTGQPLNADDFKKKLPTAGDSRARVIELRDGKRPVLKGTEDARNKADLLLQAKLLIYPITDPTYYYPPEPTGKTATELKPIPFEFTIQSRLEELDRFILKPTATTKYNFDQFDFIQEFGIAVDAVLKELMADKDAPSYIRVNAVRMLAVAAKSGATAHVPMITELIANPETKPEILVYALQAAQGLLSAFDPRQQGSLTFGKHNLKDADAVKLVTAIETVINRQTPYGDKKAKAMKPVATGIVKEKADPAAKVEKELPKIDAAAPKAEPKMTGKLDSSAAVGDHLDPEQAAVIRFIRRDAIRALAAVRYPIFSPANGPAARPLFTLARIAVNDGGFIPALGADEYGEAVMGLCNLHDLKTVNVEGLTTCIGIGIGNFARRKVGNAADASIAWKVYGIRMAAGFADWQKVLAGNTAMASATAKVTPLINMTTNQVLAPLEKFDKANPGASAPGLEELQRWINGRTQNPLPVYDDLKADDKPKYNLKPVLAK